MTPSRPQKRVVCFLLWWEKRSEEIPWSDPRNNDLHRLSMPNCCQQMESLCKVRATFVWEDESALVVELASSRQLFHQWCSESTVERTENAFFCLNSCLQFVSWNISCLCVCECVVSRYAGKGHVVLVMHWSQGSPKQGGFLCSKCEVIPPKNFLCFVLDISPTQSCGFNRVGCRKQWSGFGCCQEPLVWLTMLILEQSAWQQEHHFALSPVLLKETLAL